MVESGDYFFFARFWVFIDEDAERRERGGWSRGANRISFPGGQQRRMRTPSRQTLTFKGWSQISLILAPFLTNPFQAL
jgi:hypothetical protein